MAVSYQHLRAFNAIALEAGVSRAARRLHVSQPTLSQQLKALEERHRVTLFESRKTPLRLTRSGRDLFALTQRLFAIAADIDDLLGEGGDVGPLALRLGADNPMHAARVVELLRRRRPHIDVQVRMGDTPEVVEWLSDARIDAALVGDPPGHSGFGYEQLATDELVCVIPADHPLAACDTVPIEALGGETLLVRERTAKTRAFTERALADAGVHPRALMDLQSREVIREGIALGLGLGVFFASECPPDPRLACRPLRTPAGDYRARTSLVFRVERRRTPLIRALIGAARDSRASCTT